MDADKPHRREKHRTVSKPDPHRKPDARAGPYARRGGQPLDLMPRHQDRTRAEKTDTADNLRGDPRDVQPLRIDLLQILLQQHHHRRAKAYRNRGPPPRRFAPLSMPITMPSARDMAILIKIFCHVQSESLVVNMPFPPPSANACLSITHL